MGRVFSMRRAALLSLVLAINGCMTTASVHPDGDSSTEARVIVPAAPPSPSVVTNIQPSPLATAPIIARGTSTDGDTDQDWTPPPLHSNTGLGELPTCSLNPVIALLRGDPNPRHSEDAFESLALLGATSAMHILRQAAGGANSSGHSHDHFRYSANYLDDLLQPDDDTMRARQVRPPCFFTLGCDF